MIGIGGPLKLRVRDGYIERVIIFTLFLKTSRMISYNSHFLS